MMPQDFQILFTYLIKINIIQLKNLSNFLIKLKEIILELIQKKLLKLIQISQIFSHMIKLKGLMKKLLTIKRLYQSHLLFMTIQISII